MSFWKLDDTTVFDILFHLSVNRVISYYHTSKELNWRGLNYSEFKNDLWLKYAVMLVLQLYVPWHKEWSLHSLCQLCSNFE
jgi:hypothetical protein